MMFFLVGVIYDRAHHRNLDNFGGLGLQMPYYTGFARRLLRVARPARALRVHLRVPRVPGRASAPQAFWAGSSVVYGLPRWIVYAALPAIVLTAGYILWTIQRVYLGSPKKEEYKSFPDLSLRETLTLIPLAALCIWMGVQPQIVLGYMNDTLTTFQQFVTKGG